MEQVTMIQRRWVRWSLLFGGWTLLGLFSASRIYMSYSYTSYKSTWGQAISVALIDWYSWVPLGPVIFWLARRFPFERRRGWRSLLIHLPASLIFTILKMIIEVSIAHLSGLPARRSVDPLQFHSNYLTYWAIVGLSQAIGYYRQYREHQLKASRLETQLAQAQLQALKMQLHPHFLFNTLHAISALMHRDVEAADRMVARLSDLLRLTLENIGVQEVSLKQELEFLEGYLEIEQTRFQDRLRVHMDIDPETLDATVPNLILQPLVENAIRHGIAPRSASGRIEIRAHREDGMLQLQVRDDGPGLDQTRAAGFKEGVGLTNTRARLQQLYGSMHRFELLNAPDKGLVVNLTIPFRTATNRSPKNADTDDDKDSNADRR